MNYSVVRSTLVSRVRFISAWKSSAYQASRTDEDGVIRAVENRKRKRETEKRIKRSRENERERKISTPDAHAGAVFTLKNFSSVGQRKSRKLEANVL